MDLLLLILLQLLLHIFHVVLESVVHHVVFVHHSDETFGKFLSLALPLFCGRSIARRFVALVLRRRGVVDVVGRYATVYRIAFSDDGAAFDFHGFLPVSLGVMD